MPEVQVVNKERHAQKYWRRYTSYAFASKDTVAPLVIQEFPKACMFLPIAFLKKDDSFIPVAVQGLSKNSNLMVAPDGRWLAGYVPAAYRSYPFKLANTPEQKHVLCILEDSGLISDTEGEPFFDETGEPAKVVKDVMSFLSQIESNRQPTQRACQALQKFELIKPWPVKLKTESGEQTVDGLFTIDEAVLNQLPAEALVELRNASALIMAYCQILSTQHLQKFADLLKHKSQSSPAALQTTSGDLDLDFLNDGGNITFK